MATDIIVDAGVNQIRVGLVENQKLVELYIDDENRHKTVGNIYRGVIKRILPGLEAAFVDIGHKKNAYLDLRKLQQNLNNSTLNIKQGEHITVQVEKEAMGMKGPKVTSNINITGKYMVLIPRENSIGISRKIEDNTERERLKAIFEQHKIENCGIIIRTDSVGKSEEELIKELNFLKLRWAEIEKKETYILAPSLLYGEISLPLKACRDLLTSQIRKYIVNDRDIYEDVIKFIGAISPHLKDKIQYKEESNLFQHLMIESQIEKALNRHVWLKSGGMIIIDTTEAMTVIDVNTAKYVGKKDMEKTILKTNIEASIEIAKQLRLRNIGGIIIIDYIDMKDKADKNAVINVLEQELKNDRVKASVLGITNLGLVEMTRKKTGPSLTSLLFNKCPLCEGKGMTHSLKYIGDKIQKEIDFIFTQTIYSRITIEANQQVIKWFSSKDTSYKSLTEKKYGKKLEFIENNNLTNEKYNIIKEK
ncbi:MAG: Rne/Rng family ribonuclease [Epulopiscium sp.]|nr:Rne/Rng family ribonuclease [Candidatus Epulonipiscium sp.]